MIIRGMGLGGCINVLDGHFPYVPEQVAVVDMLHILLTRFCWISSSSVVTADGARGFAASCVKDYPHKRFKMAQGNHKQNIFTKTYHFRGRFCCKSYRTIVAGNCWYSTNWWNMETPQKMATYVDAPQKDQQVYKKRHTWAYSWTWRHNAALLQSVASALPQALWHWSVERR